MPRCLFTAKVRHHFDDDHLELRCLMHLVELLKQRLYLVGEDLAALRYELEQLKPKPRAQAPTALAPKRKAA